MDALRENLTRPRESQTVDVLVRVAIALALVLAAALASPEAGVAMLVAVVLVGVVRGGVGVKRLAFVVLGLAGCGAALALISGNGFAETDEFVFALAVLGVGMLNLVAGFAYTRVARVVALVSDALVIGFVMLILSTATIG